MWRMGSRLYASVLTNTSRAFMSPGPGHSRVCLLCRRAGAALRSSLIEITGNKRQTRAAKAMTAGRRRFFGYDGVAQIRQSKLADMAAQARLRASSRVTFSADQTSTQLFVSIAGFSSLLLVLHSGAFS